jgi:Papain family cysteine protease
MRIFVFTLLLSIVATAAFAERRFTTGDNPAWQRYANGEAQFLTFPEPAGTFEPGWWEVPETKDALPAQFDWRDYLGEDWTTPIRDQGLCAGCSAFGATAALETQVLWDLQRPDLPLDLSEQHLFSCSGGDCQTGMLMAVAMIYLKQSGVPDESCFEYQSGASGENFPCEDTCENWQERAFKVKSWNWIYHFGDLDKIKSAILEGPLYSYISVYSDFFAYTGGVYEVTVGGTPGGHGISILGWDDDEGCWIGKNSWGESWGENGFFRIAYGEADIETYMGRLVFEAEGAPPIPGYCTSDEECNDGLFCNGEETCDTTNGLCVPSENPCSDDGLWCNGDEVCDEELDECIHNGSLCVPGETCDEEAKECMNVSDDDDWDDDDSPSDDSDDSKNEDENCCG